MLTLEKMALKLDEEIYQEFKVALARGSWSSGIPMTDQQKRICNEVISIRELYGQFQSGLFNCPCTHQSHAVH